MIDDAPWMRSGEKYGCFPIGLVCVAGLPALLAVIGQFVPGKEWSRRKAVREIPARSELENGRNKPLSKPDASPSGDTAMAQRLEKLRDKATRYRTLRGQALSEALAHDRSFVAIALYGVAFFITAIAGSVLLLIYAVRLSGARPPLPQADGVEARWGLWECLVVCSFAFVMADVVTTLLWITGVPERAAMVLGLLLAPVLAGAYACHIVRRYYGQPVAALGLRIEAFWKNAGIGILAFLAMTPAAAGATWLNTVVFEGLGLPTPVSPTIDQLSKAPSLLLGGAMVLTIVCVGPLVEELMFRGLLCGALRRRFGSKWTIVVSAGIFAVLHFELSRLLPLFLVGLFLAHVYEKTRSIVASSVAHVMQNAGATVFVLLLRLVD